MKKENKVIKLLLILMVICVVAFLSYVIISGKLSFFKNSNRGKEQEHKLNNEIITPDTEDKTPPIPKLKVMDLTSKTRPIAIMVDNEPGALPHAGLQDAFLIYEVIIEGGETRFLALFKDRTTSMIGPDRSARHYFLDYALENDAIFTHFGFSPQAENDIRTLGVNNLSGTQADGSAFWREKPLGGWHNVFTSINNLTTRAKAKKYRMTSEQEPLLNYSVQQVELSVNSNAIPANSIRIDYSKAHYVTYEYDGLSKLYKKSMRGKAHVDRVTTKQYTFKNIIVYNVKNFSLNDGSGKGRQSLENIGSGDGYYITNGYATPIKWTKPSRKGKTVYTDLQGNKIKVNDGNTIIHIQPIGMNRSIK